MRVDAENNTEQNEDYFVRNNYTCTHWKCTYISDGLYLDKLYVVRVYVMFSVKLTMFPRSGFGTCFVKVCATNQLYNRAAILNAAAN